MKPSTRMILMGATDADARAWKAAVLANGGSVKTATVRAVSAFCRRAKASGYWSKLSRINLFCGDQLAAALVPLKAGGGSATDTNVNFVAGDYTEASGLTGNATTKYLNTGFLANSLSANNTHLAVYNRASAVSGSGRIGAINGTAQDFGLAAPFTDGKGYATAYASSTANLVTVAGLGTPYGFAVSSRVSSTDFALYRNGASLVSSSTASGGSLPALAIYVFARNDAGSAALLGGYPLGAYSIGSGLTGADVSAYNAHMEEFQDALGRGVQ